MNICILSHNYPQRPGDGRAAAGLFVPDFARELQGKGHQVVVFTQDLPGTKEATAGIPVVWFKWAGGDKKLGHLNPLWPVDIVKFVSLVRDGRRQLLELVCAEKIDHLLALWAIPSGWFARAAHKELGVPYSVWALGSDIWKYGRYPGVRSIVQGVLRDASLLFADGLALAKEVERLSGRRCDFLPTTRRLPKVNPAARQGSETSFLFIGRWEKAKGVDVLLDAMNLLVREGAHTRLHIFGGGSLERHLRETIARCGLDGIVHLGGYASPEVAANQLGQCDCLVIPSRIESIPIVLSDALQTGTPVIVSDVGDMGRLVRQYGVGTVVPPADSRELKNALYQFVGRADNRTRYQKNIEGMARIFDLRSVAGSFLARLSQSKGAPSVGLGLHIQGE